MALENVCDFELKVFRYLKNDKPRTIIQNRFVVYVL